eukprot:scaffold86707_cov28-Attheya_sp.AAC.1
MKLIATLSLLVSGAFAFTPSSKDFKTSSALQAVAWAPNADESAFAYGLPGFELNRARKGFAPPGEGVEFQDLQE